MNDHFWQIVLQESKLNDAEISQNLISSRLHHCNTA